jgi:hypothetical protein
MVAPSGKLELKRVGDRGCSPEKARNFRNFRHEGGTGNPPRCSFLISRKEFQMLGTILIVVLLLLLLGAWPSWPHSRAWGYYPSGTLGLVLVIVLVLALLGRI